MFSYYNPAYYSRKKKKILGRIKEKNDLFSDCVNEDMTRIKEKWWLSCEEIKRLLMTNTVSEIMDWKIEHGRFIPAEKIYL
jgi:hypothetical protein